VATIDVDPEGLRTAGGDMNESRAQLVDGSNAHLLHGVGDDRQISTAGYWPGVWAQQSLTERYNEAQEAFHNINNNFMALSSALYIVADVFETSDLDSALEFAFLNPEAGIPAGLPAYIDPKVTSVQMRQQAEVEAAVNGGGMPPGWTRRERVTSPYSKTIEIVDANGNVVGSQYMSTVGGQTTTWTYDKNNKVIGTRVEQTTDNGTTVRTYAGDNTPENLTREQYQVRNPDGSTRYYTDIHNSDGTTERTDDVTVAPESPGALPGEGLTREVDEQNQLGQNQAYRSQTHRPEIYYGFDNEIT
jgi:hypothetical protein